MRSTLILDQSPDNATRRALYDVSLSVAKSKRIVVVTGAGISCSCGIPDFRSSDGLYNLVKAKYPDVVLKGKDLFDASLFRNPESTSVFYTFISQLKQSVDRVSPSKTHHFIKTLDTQNKLLRSYTQNIDGLEAQVGLLCSSSEAARASGKSDAWRALLSIHCSQDYLALFNEGQAPDCPDCSRRSAARVARSARPIKVGTLRPAIVLYDEPHPLGDDIGDMQGADVNRKPDCLVIMGTSLKVHGLKKLVKDFARAVHSSSSNAKPRKVIFVNQTPPGSEWAGIIDVHIQGDTDVWCDRVIEDWRKARPDDWKVQKTLLDMGSPMKVVATKIKDPKKKPSKKEDENMPPASYAVIESPRKPLAESQDISMASPSPLLFDRRLSIASLSPPSSPSKRPLPRSDILVDGAIADLSILSEDDEEDIPLAVAVRPARRLRNRL
ncbi:hst3 protein [Flagelloscypha sp. PMI_526]|nr:hst3 protein [Flagelloscypha sp. PMI_526]